MDWAVGPILVMSIALEEIISSAYDMERVVTRGFCASTHEALITLTNSTHILPKHAPIFNVIPILCQHHLGVHLGSEAVYPTMGANSRLHYTTADRTQLSYQNRCEVGVVLPAWVAYPRFVVVLAIAVAVYPLVALYAF